MTRRLAIAAACKAAGVVDLHFHDLRHEATSATAPDLAHTIAAERTPKCAVSP